MAGEADEYKDMIIRVAEALGSDMLDQVVFVGGCTTSLLITDDYARDQVRHTEDVDLIIPVIGYPAWVAFAEKLKRQGFKERPDQDAPLCALFLGELRVDFMPDDEDTLGFTNRWYADAMRTATPCVLNEQITIRLVSPPYFVATKLDAYCGRGNGDALMSQDIEDILNLFNGRENLIEELKQVQDDELKGFIEEQIKLLLDHPHIQTAIVSCVQNQRDYVQLLYGRLKMATSLRV